MDQMAKGLLFGAAVLSQAAAGCFPAAAASIDRVRIRLAAEELEASDLVTVIDSNACFGGGKPGQGI